MCLEWYRCLLFHLHGQWLPFMNWQAGFGGGVALKQEGEKTAERERNVCRSGGETQTEEANGEETGQDNSRNTEGTGRWSCHVWTAEKNKLHANHSACFGTSRISKIPISFLFGITLFILSALHFHAPVRAQNFKVSYTQARQNFAPCLYYYNDLQFFIGWKPWQRISWSI